MRVIAGSAKGRQLKGPPGVSTRPTSDKVREAIFAMIDSLLEAGRSEVEIGGAWDDLRVLDLYAGTGALGIEALSRGAESAEFVEANRAACQVIAENLARTALREKGHVHCRKVQQFLNAAGNLGYDLVFMDAPYATAELEDVIELLASRAILRKGGWLVVEHAHRRPLPVSIGSLVLAKHRRYGDTAVSLFTYGQDD